MSKEGDVFTFAMVAIEVRTKGTPDESGFLTRPGIDIHRQPSVPYQHSYRGIGHNTWETTRKTGGAGPRGVMGYSEKVLG